jgi:hypothetical protein
MIALLSGAWWAQRLSGPVLQALGIAAVAIGAMVAVGLGLAWLRDDARQDEASTWQMRLGIASAEAERELARRVREAERIGAARQREREARLEDEKRQLEELLAATTLAAPPVVVTRSPPPAPRGCYSPELLRRLNKL